MFDSPHNVEVAWLTAGGTRCKGRLVRSDPPRTALRLLQHAAFQDRPRQRDWAAVVVAGKIESFIEAARHYRRHGAGPGADVFALWRDCRDRCPTATLEQLRGLEGTATAAWFELLGTLLLPPWLFNGRNRRPPRDPVNGLLSLGYTWLLARTVARCEAAGLEVNLGALHEFRPGRPSLACDLMEPLRVPAVDRWVLALCNQNQIAPGDFTDDPETGVRLQPGRFGDILQTWEEHWHTQQLEALLDDWVSRLQTWLRQGEAPLEEGAPPADAQEP